LKPASGPSADRWSRNLQQQVLSIISSSEEEGRSLTGVAARFVQQFWQLTGVPVIAIYVRDEQTKELTCLAEAGAGDPSAATERQTLLLRAERDGRATSGHLQALPLHRVGRLEGLILVHTGSKSALERRRILETVTAVQPWLAVALDHARLTRKYAAKILRIQHLKQVSDVLNSTLPEDDKLRRAVDGAVRLLEAEVGALFLTGHSAALQLRALAGERAGAITGLNSPTAAGVAKSGQALLVKDGTQDARLPPNQGWQGTMPVRTLVSVPVRAGQETVGVVEVVNKRTGKPFSNWDLLELSSLSNQFGLAIDNLRLKK
jgi:GAF domain-containing protein